MPRDATVIPLHRPLPAPAFEIGCWVWDNAKLEKGVVRRIDRHPLTQAVAGYIVRFTDTTEYRAPKYLEHTTVPVDAAARLEGPILLTEEAPPRASWRPGYGTAAVVALGLASFVVWGIV